MRLTIGDIVELVGPDGAIRLGFCHLLRKTAGDFYIIVRVPVGDSGHFDQLGTEKAEGIFLFLALRFGNNDDSAVAKRLGNHCKPDTRVTCCTLDDHTTSPQKPAFLGVADYVERCAILDGLARIEEFSLAVNFAASEVGSLLETNERRVSDGVDH